MDSSHLGDTYPGQQLFSLLSLICQPDIFLIVTTFCTGVTPSGTHWKARLT